MHRSNLWTTISVWRGQISACRLKTPICSFITPTMTATCYVLCNITKQWQDIRFSPPVTLRPRGERGLMGHIEIFLNFALRTEYRRFVLRHTGCPPNHSRFEGQHGPRWGPVPLVADCINQALAQHLRRPAVYNLHKREKTYEDEREEKNI